MKLCQGVVHQATRDKNTQVAASPDKDQNEASSRLSVRTTNVRTLQLTFKDCDLDLTKVAVDAAPFE